MRPTVPAPTGAGNEVGNRVPFPILGLHGGWGPGCPESRSPTPGWKNTEVVQGVGWGGSPYLRAENGAPPTLHAALPPGSRSPRQSSAQARGPPMLRPEPSARGPSQSPPAWRARSPALPRRQPPRTRGSPFPAQQREGGREAGAGRGRAFPASPGPSARPPAPCAAAANPEGAPGGRATPPGSPPGAHLSLVPCAACPFWERGASSEVPNHVLQTEAGPRSLTQPGPKTTKPGLMMPGAASPLDIFEEPSHQGKRGDSPTQGELPKRCVPLCAGHLTCASRSLSV